MSNEGNKPVVKISQPLIDIDTALVAGIFLCVLFFMGEPDLMDAIINRLMGG